MRYMFSMLNLILFFLAKGTGLELVFGIIAIFWGISATIRMIYEIFTKQK